MFDLTLQKQPIPPIFDTLPLWDLLILGGGPAGMNAALYAQRKGLRVGIITQEIGGQLHNTSTVDNYLGIPMIEGKDLSQAFHHHLEALEVPIYQEGYVRNLTHESKQFAVYLDNGKILKTKTLLLATGGQSRTLNIPGEKEFANKGVSYCTTCDAPFFKGQRVIVVGGGNSAAEAVIDLAPWASHITVVLRSHWRADAVTLQKLSAIKHVTVYEQTQILEVKGKDKMTAAVLFDKKNQKQQVIEADGLFVEIGLVPNSSLVKNLIPLSERGEVIVNDQFMTGLPGLFAAGDVTQHPYKQIVIAVGDGAKAALAIHQYLIHYS